MPHLHLSTLPSTTDRLLAVHVYKTNTPGTVVHNNSYNYSDDNFQELPNRDAPAKASIETYTHKVLSPETLFHCRHRIYIEKHDLTREQVHNKDSYLSCTDETSTFPLYHGHHHRQFSPRRRTSI